MKRHNYETPEIEIMELNAEDVITTSGLNEDEKVGNDIFTGIWEA